ncbi:hypothetical protein BWQ93_01370 [Sphingopyxis sp. QXT-31]|uniref:DUF427 domain-containing protein n=1 Tax=Sphingopyxis sp. QXT-31 TaxID=1357916 RepID=UPI0009791B96|nr:DUF427 domain-containing protein [Sphingopyxis sp. QXT-31]APZ97289.1 hypothetical protein BWQ93_01370 [Sphingopyxis sp. QXT-31]
MTERRMLIPDAGHPTTIAPHPGRVEVRIGDRVIADTKAAVALREASYPVVLYIPRADVDMAQLQASSHSSYCPYKGEAGYFDLPALGAAGANAVWTYEAPYDAVAAIAGHLAFYPDRATFVEHPAG